MITSLDSLRMNILRFPMIVAVVYIHAYDIHIAGTSTPILDFLRNFVSQGLARVAVPIFFLVSGYLFFTSGELTLGSYIAKLKTRVRTLLVPMMFWNLLALAIFAAMQAHPSTLGYFSGKSKLITDFSLFDFVSAVFGIAREPISYPFWFIRDLMALAMLTPLISFALRFVPRLTLGLLGLAWFTDSWPIAVPSIEACFYFTLGAKLRGNKQSLFEADQFGLSSFTLFVFLAMTALAAGLYPIPIAMYFHRIAIMIGVVVALALTRHFINESPKRDSLLALATSSFFVFAAQEPLLTIVRKGIIAATQPRAEALAIAMYIGLPIVVIALLMTIHRTLVRFTPRFAAVICGGRN
jgi:surface polysaccharide O-acyltransferase-like enzyme